MRLQDSLLALPYLYLYVLCSKFRSIENKLGLPRARNPFFVSPARGINLSPAGMQFLYGGFLLLKKKEKRRFAEAFS